MSIAKIIKLTLAAPISAGLILSTAQAQTVESEPNNTFAQANPVTTPATLSASLSSTTDVDHYVVSYIPGGECLSAFMQQGGTARYRLSMLNSRGSVIASSSNAAGRGNRVSVCFLPGPMTVRVTYISGATGPYTIGFTN